MCTAFSQLQNLNWGRSKEQDEKLAAAWKRACRHLDFAMELYQKQIDGGRYFVHEHPATASSWRMESVKRIQRHDEVVTTIGDQCEYGLTTRDRYGEAAARKPTRFMTNSTHVAEELSMRCQNEGRPLEQRHRHIPLMNGRASKAQEYPKELCEAIVKGVQSQIEADKWGAVRMLVADAKTGKRAEREVAMKLKRLAVEVYGKDVEKMDVVKLMKTELEGAKRPAEEEDSNGWIAFDDVSGASLDPSMVRAARKDEIEYFRKMGVYTKIARRKVPKGVKVIKVKWIDINKGDEQNPEMRSRLVAMEFNDGDKPGLFASTPPTEALRMLCSMAATRRKDGRRNNMMVNDVRRAYFYAKVKSEIFVELPREDKTEEDEEQDNVGRLNLSMYGTREAATNWQEEVAKHLVGIGFRRGQANQCIYEHKVRKIATLVHGDDYASTGTREDLEWLREELEKKFDIKTTLVGHDKDQEKEMKVLNRIIRATAGGWEYEGDQRHGEIIVRETGMRSAKGVTTAGEDDRTQKGGEEHKLNEGRTRWYRGVAARANYYSQDRPDMAYATKEACRSMGGPTTRDEKRVRRIGRYLKENLRLVQEFGWQEEGAEVRVYTDSDWAGGDRTRKSTSGGVIMRGRHCLKFWSKTQQTIALSSGEAELMALVKGCCEGLGMQSLMRDAGEETGRMGVLADASAAIGITRRTGLGKIRHLDVSSLWVQQKQNEKKFYVEKVDGKRNPSDMLTKNVPRETMDKYLEELGWTRRTGRAEKAAELVEN